MRYERKYKMGLLSRPIAEQAIRLHPAGFRKIYPDRQVNNVYFDTPGLSAYQDNVMGVARRKKFRVRWYGGAVQPAEARLEIKIKDNQLGKKLVYPVEAQEGLPALTKEVNTLCLPNTPLQAVLANSYQRAYFGTSNGYFRITIDHDVRYRALLLSPKLGPLLLRSEGVIVELKYDAPFEQKALEIMQHLPFRQTKSSKYVDGVMLALS